MKRMRIVGLCLVAVFALSALIVSSASAAAPEFKICGKAAKSGKLYTGHYTDKACSKHATEAEEKEGKKNKYERVEWTKAKKKTYKAKNKGTPHNNIVNPFGEKDGGESEPAKIEGTTECTKESVVGEVTGPKTEKWHTVYTSCKAEETPCNTKGAKAGEIKTEELEAELVFLNSAKTEVGLRVKGKGKEGLLAQYECIGGTLNVLVTGEVLAKTSGNINTANKKTTQVVKEGPLHMQSNLFIEGTNSEAEGKGYFEWGFEYEECVKSEVEKGHSLAEAEGICFGKIGPWKAYPNKPLSLISTVSGVKNAKAPAVQNGETEATGEAFLIET